MGCNFNIQFKCSIVGLMEQKEEDRWNQVHKQLVIQEKNKIKRKDGWIWKVIEKIDNHCEHVEITERDNEVIIDFYNFCESWYVMSREECYKDALLKAENDRLDLKKLRIKNYNFTYEYEPSWDSEDIFSKGKEILNEDEVHF